MTKKKLVQSKKEQKILDKISIHMYLDFAQLLWTVLLKTQVIVFLILVNCLYAILPPKHMENIWTEHQTPVVGARTIVNYQTIKTTIPVPRNYR